MAANDPNIPKEEILDEDEYPQRSGKQPMAPPPQDAQAPPPQDVHVPPRRTRGQPRKNTATRRAKQPPPPTEQPVPSRPQRGNRAEGAANPTAEAPVGIGNNRTPSKAQTRNPGATQNVQEDDRMNSGPSRPHNGRQPPSPIRHPPSPIRHPSPIRRDAQPAHRDRERRVEQRHGNEDTVRERRGPHPTRNQVSRSQTIEIRRPAGNPSRNNHATSHVSEISGDARFVSIYNSEPGMPKIEEITQIYGSI
ncbi:uncharacterized protein LOC133832921 [Humulus lupulus]|uniref:uncharacterized protein LOC133832921 n=1 Tax=Humulus lupulus TaxID=3486 RepID=UPI002B41228F|nr:uncharacterized protein LOC133832921 [Humulus lupulus]